MNWFSNISLKWWLFIITTLGLFTFLVVRVNDKAHPWERVIVSESGLEQTGILDSKFCCFSADEESLFVATPNGLIEQWDLESFKKIRSFGDELKQGVSHFTGAMKLEVNAAGELIEYGRGHISKYTQEGELITKIPTETKSQYAISPNGLWVAEFYEGCKFTHLVTGETFKIGDSRMRRSPFSPRMQWASDSKSMLIHSNHSLMMVDIEAKKLKFERQNADQDLNGENESKKEKELRSDDIILLDSKLVANESKIASIYDGEVVELRKSAVSPNENVLIFNDAKVGEQLKRIHLPHRPRSMWVSADGAEVYVTMVDEGKIPGVLAIFDAYSMEELALIKSQFSNAYPTRAVGLDGKNVAQFRAGAWLQDWNTSYLPIRLEPLKTGVAQILPNKNADVLAITLQNRDIHVWKKRREPSRWGTFALWEYWASLLILTTLLLIIITRLAVLAQRGGRKFRYVEWFIIIVSALGLSYRISTLVYLPLISDIWSYPLESIQFKKVIYVLFSSACIVGFAMQRDYWRKMFRFLSLMGALVFLFLFVSISLKVPIVSLDVYFAVSIPEEVANGVLWNRTMFEFIMQIGVIAFYGLFSWWILRVPFRKWED